MLVLPAALTQSQAQATLAQLEAALAQISGPRVVVDGAALLTFDSAALAVLLALRRRCQSQGKTLVCERLTPRLAALAALYGIEALLANT
jgi:phospholipid transport system transporter-binding protein